MNAPFPRCRALKSCQLTILFCAILAPAAAEAGEHSLGVGTHFFKTVDRIVDDPDFADVEDDGYAFVASYRYRLGGLVFSRSISTKTRTATGGSAATPTPRPPQSPQPYQVPAD
jgi:hypothetical protein